MKNKSKLFYGLLVILILSIALAACQSDESSATAESDIHTDEAVASTEDEAPAGEDAIVFFDENAATPEPIVLEDAVVTESGLQFLEVSAGEGPAPQSGDIVVMNAIGTLPDGTEIANTYTQGLPFVAIFGREQLLPGWEEGVGMMKEGGQAQLVLPPELAFGEEGYGMIPPNSQVVLEIELVAVDAPPTPKEVSDDEWVTTESGLQYVDLAEGEGDAAVTSSTVTTHYVIWVQGESENTYIVDSRYNQPISFIVGRLDTVFAGWDEGVNGMMVGGKRQLVIPPELALGETSSGDIPANATLVMEIELLDLSIPPQMTAVDEANYTETESGLKYYDFVEGDGATPEAGQTVVVHYSGWLEDGTPFDSSVERGQPFSFELGAGAVIAGWDEGLSTMQVGGKRQLVIPPELGYGEAGAGGLIPPGATLIFEVELLEIQE